MNSDRDLGRKITRKWRKAEERKKDNIRTWRDKKHNKSIKQLTEKEHVNIEEDRKRRYMKNQGYKKEQGST